MLSYVRPPHFKSKFQNISFTSNSKSTVKSRPALYASDEGKYIQDMNRAALLGIKNGPFKPQVKDEQDIALINSNNPEDCKKWVVWVNPKNGKTYTVINKTDNQDGTKTVRILDSSGNLVKETNIKPKKIIVIDSFYGSTPFDYSKKINFSHKDLVQTHVARNNPLADIEYENISEMLGAYNNIDRCTLTMMLLKDRMDEGEKIDAVNCSFGAEMPVPDKDIYANPKELLECYFKDKYGREDYEKMVKAIENLTEQGTKVFFASGNYGEDSVSLETTIDGVDIVGAFSKDAKIAKFSASRGFSKHYELGEYDIKQTNRGINLTGLAGNDIAYEDTPYKDFAGKKLADFLVSDNELEEYKAIKQDRQKDRRLRFSHDKRLDKYDNKVFRLMDLKPKSGIKEEELQDLYYNPKRELVMKENADGILVPYMPKTKYSGTSFSAPVRTAKYMLNETMQEILNT